MQVKKNKMFLVSTLAAAIAVPSLAQAAFVDGIEQDFSLRNLYRY